MKEYKDLLKVDKHKIMLIYFQIVSKRKNPKLSLSKVKKNLKNYFTLQGCN